MDACGGDWWKAQKVRGRSGRLLESRISLIGNLPFLYTILPYRSNYQIREKSNTFLLTTFFHSVPRNKVITQLF